MTLVAGLQITIQYEEQTAGNIRPKTAGSGLLLHAEGDQEWGAFLWSTNEIYPIDGPLRVWVLAAAEKQADVPTQVRVPG